MAKRTKSKPMSTPALLVLGAVAGLMLAAALQLPTGWGALAGAVVAYLGRCRKRPWIPCPWCTGKTTTEREPSGAYGVNPTCRVCGGDRWPRLGTRLLMAVGFNPRT